MKKQKTNKVKTVVYLIHFILIDIWARNGVLHIFLGGDPEPGTYIYIFTSTVSMVSTCNSKNVVLARSWFPILPPSLRHALYNLV